MYVLCDNYYEEVIYCSCKGERIEIRAENKYVVIQNVKVRRGIKERERINVRRDA